VIREKACVDWPVLGHVPSPEPIPVEHSPKGGSAAALRSLLDRELGKGLGRGNPGSVSRRWDAPAQEESNQKTAYK
jgi:hypothetical protein